MKKQDFYYDLPEELIAQTPVEPRNFSRMLRLDRQTGETGHYHFYDLPRFLRPGDCLILNDTRVLPARLFGVKEGTGAVVEFVLLKQHAQDTWEALAGPGKKAKPGSRFVFGDGLMTAQVLEIVDGGNRIIRFAYNGVFYDLLDQIGQMPLPPYITQKLEDKERYQTVYAKELGSAAAPTAGLHFTPDMLREIEQMGVSIGYVTLHVGLGTFRPVKEDEVEKHKMHTEHYYMPAQTAALINRTKASGGRVICVGTTSCRTVESAAPDDGGPMLERSGDTDIFIYPGYTFKCMDGLITNFHLPESTLIMLVCAFAGYDHVMDAYRQAVADGYRFFSFGDAMLVL